MSYSSGPSETGDTGESSHPNGHIELILIDDHPTVRNALRSAAEDTIDTEVVGETGSAEEAFVLIEEQAPDVAVVDLSLSDGHGFDLLDNFQAHCPETRLLVFSMFDENVYAERVLRAGASGYLMKAASAEEARFPIDELTDRELQVFQMLGQGLTLSEIADRLSLARKTVETYRRRAREKLGVESAEKVVAHAAQWTLAQPEPDEEETRLSEGDSDS